MIRMSKSEFKIKEPVDKLPAKAFPRRVLVYDQLLKALDKKPNGIYPIEVTDKKPMTVYIALSKRLKGKKDLKIHFIDKTVYIEKL
jgi:hypothetical protein